MNFSLFRFLCLSFGASTLVACANTQTPEEPMTRRITDVDEAIAALNDWASKNPRRDADYSLPPWEYAPALPRTDMGWRMGGYENYLDGFKSWFRALSDEEKANFIVDHPEPEEWVGFYEIIE